jgi:hypothetical protein
MRAKIIAFVAVIAAAAAVVVVATADYGQRAPLVHERLPEVAEDQQEADPEPGPALRSRGPEERLHEQAQGRGEVSERHRYREVDRRAADEVRRRCRHALVRPLAVVEYTRSSPTGRYSVLGQGQLCTSCHIQARSNDWVFTKR